MTAGESVGVLIRRRWKPRVRIPSDSIHIVSVWSHVRQFLLALSYHASRQLMPAAGVISLRCNMLETILGRVPHFAGVRDAVHVPCIAMVADVDLKPSQEVTGGIVDPFRKSTIKAGELYWLCLLPGSIKSLRHQWEHDAFPASTDTPANVAQHAESVEWLRNYAINANRYTVSERGEEAAYEELLEGLRTGDLYFHGSDLHGEYDLDDANELRRHGEIVLGRSIDFGNFRFSCSC